MGVCGVVAMVVAGSLVAGPGFSPAPFPGEASVQVVSERTIEAALERLTPRLMSLSGVVGVGEGRCDGSPCIRILVVERSGELVEQIHDVVGDIPIEIIESGEIRARPTE